MIAPKKLDTQFKLWNQRWKAPFGRTFLQKLLPKTFRKNYSWGRFAGMFAYQPNNDTRIFEYPWAYYVADLQKNSSVVDIGGGFSGFSFVLSKNCHDVVNVDPFLDYGPTKHYDQNPHEVIQKMNKMFHTNVQLKKCSLDQAGFKTDSVDRIFCISVIEHLSDTDRQKMLNSVQQILKPKGLFILTVDLFLNLIPFTNHHNNPFGQNVSIKNIVDESGMTLISGEREELNGFEEFNPEKILSNIEKYHIGNGYPALVQAFVLEK